MSIKLTPEKPPYYEQGTKIKIYKALISQVSTDPPTVVIQQNTIGNIIWTRNATGIYVGTLTGTYNAQKIWCNLQDSAAPLSDDIRQIIYQSDSTGTGDLVVIIETFKFTTTRGYVDQSLYYTPLEINIFE